MDSDQNYEDLIKEYQILLENEKRRLNTVTATVTEKCANPIETKVEIDISSERIEFDASQDESQKIYEDSKSTEISKIVEEIVVDKPNQTNPDKRKTNPNKRTEMMEQWVTDSFYTSFPSFKQQDLNANRLSENRREDYRKYLAEVSNKKLLDAVKGRRSNEHSDSELMFHKSSSTSKPSDQVKYSPRDQLLNDLKHSDLAYNFHSADYIDDRNQRVAMERHRKKMELQQELIGQIEEKKMQIERIRAKEKEEEKLLQRRLENQLKALQLTDELTKRNNEKVLISKPIHQTPRIRDPVHRKDSERFTDNYQSKNGLLENRSTNDVNANDDRQIYKFFSNSAPHYDGEANYYNHPVPVGFNSLPMVDPHFHHTSTAIHNPTQHCNRCRRVVPILCGACYHNELNPSYFCCYRCNLLQNLDACNNCRRAWVQSWSSQHMNVNRSGVNYCHHQRDNRPQILEITYQDHGSQTTSPPKSDRIQGNRSDSPDSPDRNPIRNDKHSPMMTHSEKMVGIGGIFSDVPEAVSLSKQDELMELKRKNDILIAKYARNYGSLRNRKSDPKEQNSSQSTEDSFPLPLMREHLTTTASKGADVETKRGNSRAVRQLEFKWEIPAVQKQLITNKPDKVFTQVGAIAKQLQLEKLNFGND